MASTKPANIALCYTRGDSVTIPFIVKDKNGRVVDITGATFLLTVDPSTSPVGAGNNLFQLTATLVNPLSGSIEFPITDVQSDQIPAVYFYDIQMTDGGGKRTIAKSTFEFLPHITQ